MSAAVEFDDATFAIGGRAILQNFRLKVEPGETLVLLGRSGSGKTTALKLVNGLLVPTGGRVLVEGKPTGEWDLVQLRRRIGYVIQEAGLFPHFRVSANVGLVPKLEGWPPEKINARVNELLEQVGLPGRDYGERYPRQLSGGQRQRVGVARALAADPPLLLLDEPFGALDPVTRLDIQRQFLKLRDTLRKTAIFVTHDVREALMLGTRIALLREGRLEVLEDPHAFLQSQNPEAHAFLECLDWRPR
ncbi:MAG: ATP-binding cassette domain-containing protein [Acidobacteriota bacterium]|nr:ATP-binding cassette domain-containing protein [Acidobacteriota bacterium]